MDGPFIDNCRTIIIASQSWLIRGKIFSKIVYVFGIFTEGLKEGCEHFRFHQAK